MGTYMMSAEEIADLLVALEEQGEFQGNFTESDMVEGARLFCEKLRKEGADIAKGTERGVLDRKAVTGEQDA